MSNITTLTSGASTRAFTFHLSETASFTVRAIIDDAGDPWFVAADVCAALELGNVSAAISRLDDDEKGVISIDTLGGAQQVATVNESGLFSLILGSRKPEAKPFKRWVTAEVLPSIRKTGGYQQAPAPVELSRMDILRLAMESEEARLKAEAERDEAIRTKAMIGSKREATAMATASAAKRETAKLREELGACARHATITAVQNATGTEYSFRPMRTWCANNGATPTDVPDKRYGKVKAWPAAAWAICHDVDLSALFGEVAA